MRKNHFFIILTVALTFTLLQTPIATATTFQSEESDWWSSDWKYRRRVDITENSGYSITDFPVEVTFEHQGKAQLDGDDIRVIADGMEIPTYVEELSTTHAKAIFQVTISALATETFYVYYGNPDATKPNYQLVPSEIVEGTPGNAIIDDSVYLGWDNKIWGLDTRHLCIPWTEYKIDFDGNGDLGDNDDLIPDYGDWGSAIGRYRLSDIGSIGLGTYQGYTRTPIYVDINFQNAKLRVYRHHTWVETTQADYLLMFSPSYDHANYGGGLEQNIVDGEGTNPRGWTGLYNSPTNPGWMALRDSTSGNVFAASGLRIGENYCYTFGAKEMPAWDRFITFDTCVGEYPLAPHDQPSDARIYWYGDNTNSYSNIEITANILNNQPSIFVGSEESYSVKLSIKLTGELDYLFMENVKIRLAAIVKNAASMEPISDADVTIEIYDPAGDLWVSGTMIERLTGTGIYEWESRDTIRNLRLKKGVYLVHGKASFQEGPIASDILEFHIDPEPEGTDISTYLVVGVIALIGIASLILLRRPIYNRVHRFKAT